MLENYWWKSLFVEHKFKNNSKTKIYRKTNNPCPVQFYFELIQMQSILSKLSVYQKEELLKDIIAKLQTSD